MQICDILNYYGSSQLASGYIGKAISCFWASWTHGHPWNIKGIRSSIRSVVYFWKHPFWLTQRWVIKGKFPFHNSYLTCSSMRVKLDAASKIICIAKTRTGSTYAPGSSPELWDKLSISLSKWIRFSKALPQGEIVHAILSLCPLKMSHGPWQLLPWRYS